MNSANVSRSRAEAYQYCPCPVSGYACTRYSAAAGQLRIHSVRWVDRPGHWSSRPLSRLLLHSCGENRGGTAVSHWRYCVWLWHLFAPAVGSYSDEAYVGGLVAMLSPSGSSALSQTAGVTAPWSAQRGQGALEADGRRALTQYAVGGLSCWWCSASGSFGRLAARRVRRRRGARPTAAG